MPTKHQVPPELAKRGITGLSDNRAGRDIKLPPGTLVTFFGDELRARFARKGALDERPAAGPGGT